MEPTAETYADLDGFAVQKSTGGYFGVYIPVALEVADVIDFAERVVYGCGLVRAANGTMVRMLRAWGVPVYLMATKRAGARSVFPRCYVAGWAARAWERGAEGRALLQAWGKAEPGTLALATAGYALGVDPRNCKLTVNPGEVA